MRIYCFISFLVPLIGLSASANIVCKYEDTPWHKVGSVYHCDVQNDPNITSRDTEVIESVNEDHEDEKGKDDIRGFYLTYKTVHYFPQGLEKFYKNLKLIVIMQCGLKEIHQSDLKPFPQLAHIGLIDNEIEVIEKGLFDYNPLLKDIELSHNKISHIHTDVFDKLNNLNHLWLKENLCIDMYTDKIADELKEIIRAVKEKCPSPEQSPSSSKNLMPVNAVALMTSSLIFGTFMCRSL